MVYKSIKNMTKLSASNDLLAFLLLQFSRQTKRPVFPALSGQERQLQKRTSNSTINIL